MLRCSRILRGGFALGLLVVSMICAAPAASEPDPQRKAEASGHLKRGAELIDAEDLTGALAEFEAAYRLVPSPTILHNFGIVYQGLGRKAAALDAFQRFLDEAATAPPDARAHASEAVQTLRGEVAELRVEADMAGASIFVDARKVGQTPQEKPIYLDPGPHHLAVEKAGGGRPFAQRLQVSAGQRLTVPARLAPPPMMAAETKAPPPAPQRAWQRPAAWATTAVATAAAGVFATTYLLHRRRINKFNETGCGTDDLTKYPPPCPSLLKDAEDMEKPALVSGLATAALGLGAAALFLTLPDAPVQVSLRVSSSQLGLGLQGRF